MNKKLLLFCSGVMLSTSLWAQTKTISGKVTNASDGTSMSNVTVSIKGKAVSTQTNPDGSFTIKADPGDVLIFSTIGSKPLQQTVGSSSTVNIALSNSEEALTEVVVTAMGIKKEKKALGYAVQDIKADELMKNKNPNVINSLNGKIAGVNVTNSGGSPGGSASIVIRGGTSLERDNQPLFVIDGMPMDNSTGQGDNSAFDGNTNISTTNGNRALDINPEDIESISVLKGPAAAALYGLRAAAGAVVITTKKGKEGATSIGINSRIGTNWVNRLPKQQDKFKQGSYYNGLFIPETSLSWGDAFKDGEKIYNNMEDFYQTATTYDNSFNVSGGSAKGNFYLSGSNIKQSGVVPTTDFDRTTFRFNAEQKTDIFTFGANASFARSSTRKTLTGSGLWGGSGSGYMESIIAWPRNSNMRDWINPDGSQHLLLPNIPLLDNADNPYWTINKNPQNDKTDRFLGTAYASAKITSWLDATYRLGIDNYTTDFSTLISPGSAVKLAWQNGMLSEGKRQYSYLNSNFMLNFHKVIAEDWDLNLLLGTSAEDTHIQANSLRAENFSIPNFQSINNAENGDKYLNQVITDKRLLGVYGEFRAGYKNLAFFSVTGRNDWSSTLPIQNRSFFYPSVSGSLIFTELMEKNDMLSFGKLRASYAQVGKDAPAYQTNTYLFGPELTIGGGYRNAWTRGNDQLKPETTTSMEFGTELKFLKNRLGLDFTYYQNNSKDQILQPRVSNATGYILSYVNTGEIENKGFEISLNATPIKRDHFTWDMMLNFSHNKGVVKSLPAALPILYVTDVQVGNGKAASFGNGNFMGLSGSTWQKDADGNLLLDWETGNPLTSTLTTTPIGNREPDFIGGLTNNFTYKNWDFSFLFDFRKGGDILNGTEYLMTTYGLSKETENRGQTLTFTGKSLNPVTKEYETVTREVIATEKYYRDIYANNTPFFVEKVNWLRLRSVSLTYSLPSSILKRSKVFKGASFNVTGTNLWLLTNYSGMDPETSAAGAGVIGSGSVGIDYAGVPATAGFTFGVNLKF
ncbi:MULTISPECIES: SusC/RagA family TonB-linked outer membrane protein [Sphingobacterium]|uniref:SusC/RagA family TonB-linked outer membrane protein n=1 Tax=Sphingobacterium TaxID=28453 RepID=UPI00104403C4|nr:MULTISPECIES: SusC/RagA family TonB-linked outer membrane protein [Sphingobacterium]MCW2262341.1 TonB-linked SusC/RagA family outer membrane protein [Sphingobacterium kitahiroshimense]NJI74757.1 SusC/RagA family TonB-linked outer membrane protein [Sphingobacterium sp. B16(2022)]TCR12911.1 TonB-linked SusC/RagA family outer membrane protein [Sphingobacterium sp. JUb78]